jgi:predicted dehydrogenase/threonine dehydrogenase-like Zn-dependent dehydrogenase
VGNTKISKMKAVQQEYKTGSLTLAEVDIPEIKEYEILVKNETSVVSVGTEQNMIDLARRSLIGKAIKRPDLVKRVIESVRSEGIAETYRQVSARLEDPILLGYSSSGIVQQTGKSVTKFKPGDRVACTGSGYASHAEFIAVPQHLCALLPTEVSFTSGAFCALGGISLESIKLAQVQKNETVGVIGIGLIGLITVQLLASLGCKVIALDIDSAKLSLAQSLVPTLITTDSYSDFKTAIDEHTAGIGADSIIITASTNSNEPIEASAEAVRIRGTVISTGLTGLDIPRQLFYEKELQFAVSKAWGDDKKEPVTSNRPVKHPTAFQNISQFLQSVADQQCDVESLITGRYNISDALDAYHSISTSNHNHIGLVLDYNVIHADPKTRETESTIHTINQNNLPSNTNSIATGVIGAGLYASGTFLPAIKDNSSFVLASISAPNSVRLKHIQQKYKFQTKTTKSDDIILDPAIQLAIILTRHDSHAYFVQECLKANKHVFVEKPLALNIKELKSINTIIKSFEDSNRPTIMVGFNRRFSKFSKWAKQQLTPNTPITINITVNSGTLDPNRWSDQPEQGGRIIGEVCHFVDLVQFLSNSQVTSVSAYETGIDTNNTIINLQMNSGAIANITYVTSGNKRYRREFIEIFCASKIITIDNFKKASCISRSTTNISNWLSTDRGHKEQLNHLKKLINKSVNPDTLLSDYINTTLTTFAIEKSITTNQVQNISSYQNLI